LYYFALHLTAGGAVNSIMCSKPRAIFLSALGSGMAAVLMYVEQERRSRRVLYASMEVTENDTRYGFQSSEGGSQDTYTLPSVEESNEIERKLKGRKVLDLLSLSVAIACPAVAYSSRTLAFFASMSAFLGLTILDSYQRPNLNEPPQGPSFLPCTMLWMLKFAIRKLARHHLLDWCTHGRGLGAFDVGSSVFGPVAFNLALLRRCGGSLKGTTFLFVELLTGTALGNAEMASTAALFAVLHATYEIAKVTESLPVAVLCGSGAAIYVSSLMLRESNRVTVLNFLRCIFLV
jgi:hypothetical protein